MNVKRGPIMSYFGGKWRLAKYYGPPRYDTVVEPFAGGACYSLFWRPVRVILIEADLTVFGVWDFIKKASREEILNLPLTDEFESTEELIYLPKEARDLIGFWLGMCITAPQKKMSSMAKNHLRRNYNTCWCAYIRERVANAHDTVANWTIINGDYSCAPDITAHWFIDPPYQKKGVSYKTKFNDYGGLAEWARARRGFVQVCENDGADWLPFRPFRISQSINSRLGKQAKSHEVLWEHNC